MPLLQGLSERPGSKSLELASTRAPVPGLPKLLGDAMPTPLRMLADECLQFDRIELALGPEWNNGWL